MAKLYKTDGTVTEVVPENGKVFSYKELQGFIGGEGNLIMIVPLPSGKSIVVNEEGKLNNLPFNEKASEYWLEEYPVEKYPLNNDGTIVGDALVATDKELGDEEEEEIEDIREEYRRTE